MTLVKELPLPEVTLAQRIAFGILCTKEVYDEPSWNKWADNWLNGKDRSARAAATAAGSAAGSAAVWVIEAVRSAEAAGWAVDAVWAGKSAVNAASLAAAANDSNIDLIKIAKKAMRY